MEILEITNVARELKNGFDSFLHRKDNQEKNP
jgi:hypothetical protein